MYYTSMLHCWQLVMILVKTNHARVGHHNSRWRLRRRRGEHRRSNNRGSVRHPELGNITRPNRKRWTDVLQRLTLGVRPLRHGHRHNRCQVIFLRHVLKILQFIVIVVWKVLLVHLLSSSYYQGMAQLGRGVLCEWVMWRDWGRTSWAKRTPGVTESHTTWSSVTPRITTVTPDKVACLPQCLQCLEHSGPNRP
jgi:hypothetical protein